MSNELQEELSIFKETVVRFIENEVAPQYEAWEKNKIIPKSFYQQMVCYCNGNLGCCGNSFGYYS